MRTQGILGSVLLVIGVALLIIGINASQSPLEQAAQTLLGRYTNGTVWYLVAGLVRVWRGW